MNIAFNWIKLAREATVSVLIAVILTGSGAMYLYDEKEKIDADWKELYKEKLDFQKRVGEEKYESQKRKAELDSRDFFLQQKEKEFAVTVNSTKQLAERNASTTDYLKKVAAEVSLEKQIKEASDKIENLARERAHLGVNLNTRLKCGDIEGQRLHAIADALDAQIEDLVRAYKLEKKYPRLINRMKIWHACDQ